jgi:hypothetical protein
MSIVSPKIFLCEDQLRDFFGTPVICAATKRTQDWDRLIGDELEFNLGLAPGYSKGYEFSAATVDPNIRGGYLPPYGRHRPIESGNFDYVVQHTRCSEVSKFCDSQRTTSSAEMRPNDEHRQRAP